MVTVSHTHTHTLAHMIMNVYHFVKTELREEYYVDTN